jgi:hypothetical protein
VQIDRGEAQVAMAQLALDDVDRHASTRELDRMRVPQLMRSEPTPTSPTPVCSTSVDSRSA